MGDIFGIFGVEGWAYIQDANWVTCIFLGGGGGGDIYYFWGDYKKGVY